MNSVPRLLMLFVLAMIVIYAVFTVVSQVVDSQGNDFVNQGNNVSEGLDCVFANKDSADEDCLKSESGSSTGGVSGS